MESSAVFFKKVVRIVSSIKRGKTMTYKEVAARAGNLKAAQAVGNILSKYYRDCLKTGKRTIPCHRVIRSDGTIGGYIHGEKQKRISLKKEGAI